jgi:hypothetical protein
MTYSASHTIQSELENLSTLSRGTRAYFQQRQRNRFHSLVVKKFKEAQTRNGLTKAELARRMGKAPEVVTRLIQSPGNWRLDTLSDALLAIAGEEIEATSISPLSRPARNYDPAHDLESKINKPSKEDPGPTNNRRDYNKQLAMLQ